MKQLTIKPLPLKRLYSVEILRLSLTKTIFKSTHMPASALPAPDAYILNYQLSRTRAE